MIVMVSICDKEHETTLNDIKLKEFWFWMIGFWDICLASVLEQLRFHVLWQEGLGCECKERMLQVPSNMYNCICATVSCTKSDSRAELQLTDVDELLLLVRTQLWIKESRQRILSCPQTALSVL